MYSPTKEALWRILGLIRKYSVIPTTELVKQTGLTHASVTMSINTLQQDGIIQPMGKIHPKGMGRPCQSYALVSETLFSLGIALHTLSIKLLLTDLTNKIVTEVSFPNDLRVPSKAKQTLEKIHSKSVEMLSAIDRSRLLGICISPLGDFSGEHDVPTQVYSCSSLKQLNELKQTMQTEFGCHVNYVNDIDASLIAERWALQGVANPAPIMYLNDLLGYSILMEGGIFLANFLNPRRWLGFFPVLRNTKPYPPHFYGCLASTGYLGAFVDQMLGVDFGSRDQGTGGQIRHEFNELYRRYNQNDPDIVHIVQKGFKDIGFAARSLCLVLGVNTLIMDGWSDKMRKDGISIVQKIFDEAVWDGNVRKGSPSPVIRENSFGSSQLAYGAAMSAIEFHFKRYGRISAYLQ